MSARQGDGAPPVPACRKSVKNRAIQNAGRLYSLAETQREVLDRINRIDRIDGSGDSNALQSNLDTPTHENPVVPRVGEPIFFCRERQSSDRAFRIWEEYGKTTRDSAASSIALTVPAAANAPSAFRGTATSSSSQGGREDERRDER